MNIEKLIGEHFVVIPAKAKIQLHGNYSTKQILLTFGASSQLTQE
jgi:hypothetical protein